MAIDEHEAPALTEVRVIDREDWSRVGRFRYPLTAVFYTTVGFDDRNPEQIMDALQKHPEPYLDLGIMSGVVYVVVSSGAYDRNKEIAEFIAREVLDIAPNVVAHAPVETML